MNATVAEILREGGFVPVVPEVSRSAGTPESKAASHVPVVPVVPVQKYKGENETAESTTTEPLHDRLRRIAQTEGLDPALADRLPAGEEAEYSALDDDQLRGLLACWRDDSYRERGIPAPGDTERGFCAGCGPVLLPPIAAAGIERTREGVPVLHGCPWCRWRTAGVRLPRPKVTCDDCLHIWRDTVNPAGGQCRCQFPGAGPRWHFPHERHACPDWRPQRC